MVDAAVTQEPVDFQELLYAKSKPVLANMLAPEIKTGKAKNYKVVNVERARGLSMVTLQITKDPEVDIATATPDQIREVTVDYEHHNLQDVIEHFLGKGPYVVPALPTELDDLNEYLLAVTDRIMLDSADIQAAFNGSEAVLYVKDPKDLRWYGNARLEFVVGDEVDAPTEPETDPNEGATFDVNLTLASNGQGPLSSTVQPGDKVYAVIKPIGLVTNKAVTLDLGKVNVTASVDGSANFTLVPGVEKIVAVSVTSASAPGANLTALLKDQSGDILEISRGIDVPQVKVIPTAITLTPTTGHMGGPSTVVNYEFDETPYSGKVITLATSNPGVTAKVYDPANSQWEDGNIYVTFDQAQIADLEVIEIDVTIDGLTAKSSLTYHHS